MKIIRHLTPAGPAYAALQPDGSALALEGEHFTTLLSTGQSIAPGKLLAPLDPTNILGIGLNYRRHAEEGGKAVPTRPMWFMKTTNTVQNPGDPIRLPASSTKVDYEGELAIILGKPARNVPKAEALSYVFGYTIANDISARDWQFEWGGGQFCHAKSFDTFCPLGPVIVTADEIPNPNALRLVTTVNGETRQDWTTADMVFDVPTLISFLSEDRTLPAGTVILTGTPHGVGYACKPPCWLKSGDQIAVSIDSIGTLANGVL
ncbi:5-carboxymethyl-2-hydroxymuconate isomerase [Nibricoccus aquaticus]|uniref:5-carboxymethyl-2-hydroxymuconate isomerase n=1 Tax=Nibricoccus aquaticus TaxID=2576891 RepID=A0A290Q7L9_9BACT|nr:fumarylacetoacetate hydrolase family protein [Nibricoccus aquaticus]ATC64413.1 5-carboxymethyl-2-hydroxymuconate isomerase [Nibricoccus aquaticus]